jgi:ribosome biogenesis GTPase
VNKIQHFNFIDRFFSDCWGLWYRNCFSFNKIDTLDEVTLDEQLYMQHVYQQIGYTCLRVY